MSFFLLTKPNLYKKLRRWLVLLVLPLVLAACSVQEGGSSWPGIVSEGSRVYVAYANQVVAIDGETGRQVWQYNGQSSSEQFFAPPLVSEGRVIIGDYGISGGIFAGGRLIVKIHAIEDGDTNPPQTAWVAEEQVSGRIFASALQVEDRVYVGTGNNTFVALDAATGSLVWEIDTSNAIWGKPAYYDGVVYITSLDKNVYALDADSGNLIWSTTLQGAIASAPVLNEAEELLYVGSFSGGLFALNLDDGSIAWDAPAGDWVWGSPSLADGVVYYADLSGKIYAVSAANGQAVWAEPVQLPGSIESRLLATDNQIFAASGDEESATGTLAALSPAGEILWQKEVKAPIQSPAVEINGDPVITYVSEGEPLEVVRYDRANGEIVWRFTPPVEDE